MRDGDWRRKTAILLLFMYVKSGNLAGGGKLGFLVHVHGAGVHSVKRGGNMGAARVRVANSWASLCGRCFTSGLALWRARRIRRSRRSRSISASCSASVWMSTLRRRRSCTRAQTSRLAVSGMGVRWRGTRRRLTVSCPLPWRSTACSSRGQRFRASSSRRRRGPRRCTRRARRS